MIRAKINNMPVTVEEGVSILDAAKNVQITIPTLCIFCISEQVDKQVCFSQPDSV